MLSIQESLMSQYKDANMAYAGSIQMLPVVKEIQGVRD